MLAEKSRPIENSNTLLYSLFLNLLKTAANKLPKNAEQTKNNSTLVTAPIII
jgi:hypothetical protein